MANTIPSANMGMPIPTVSVDPGPDWANNVNASLGIVDQHNHGPGQGVLISPSGLNINADLAFNGNNAISLRSTRFNSQGAVLAGASDLDCLYVVGADLFYNDGNGNNVRITQSGSVTGSTGTITGLPSGTASAAYAASTFTFQSATSTPATINSGPLVIGLVVASSKTVTLTPPIGIANDYTLTLPLAVPSTNATLVSDTSGNLSFSAMVTGTFSPTFGGTSSSPSTTWSYSLVGNVVVISTVDGSASFTKNGSIGPITITNVPAQLLTTTNVPASGIFISYNDGGTPVNFFPSSITATTLGFTIFRDAARDAFGANSQSTIGACSFTYVLR